MFKFESSETAELPTQVQLQGLTAPMRIKTNKILAGKYLEMAESICDIKYTLYRELPIELLEVNGEVPEFEIVSAMGNTLIEDELVELKKQMSEFVYNSVQLPDGYVSNLADNYLAFKKAITGRDWRLYRVRREREIIALLMIISFDIHPVLNCRAEQIGYFGIDPAVKNVELRRAIKNCFHSEINAGILNGTIISTAIDHWNWRSLRHRLNNSRFNIHSVLFSKKKICV